MQPLFFGGGSGMADATNTTTAQGFRADRLEQLPPYLFVEIDRKKREAIEAGRDVIDFGVGDPDLPTPDFIVERLSEAAGDSANHRYAPSVGTIEFRQAVAAFFAKRYGVDLGPKSEVIALIGAKEGIGHLPLAVINPGDVVIVPEPGYPVYVSGAVFAGGECHVVPLSAERSWLPDLSTIPDDIRERAKILWLNYPNNPTGAVAPISFFEEAVAFARENDLLVAQDAAYNEVYFEDPPASILQVDGAKDVAIEFHSLSKTFNMTGWRLAFAVGNAEVVSALAAVKSNLDSGAFGAIQQAGIAALEGIDRSELSDLIGTYRRRRDAVVNGLLRAGWEIDVPDATLYVWARCPGGKDSMTVATRLLDEANVVVIPGSGFGTAGEGFVRLALTVPEDLTLEAMERIARVSW